MTRRVADALRGALTVAFGTARWIVDGLTDDEYFWQPLPDCWAVRRREDARTSG